LEEATGRRGSAPWRAGREPRATEAARLAARGATGDDDSRASPVHNTGPVEGDFSPGLALCQRSLAHRVDGWRINPMQSGQDPMHLYGGGPGRRVGLVPGQAGRR